MTPLHRHTLARLIGRELDARLEAPRSALLMTVEASPEAAEFACAFAANGVVIALHACNVCGVTYDEHAARPSLEQKAA